MDVIADGWSRMMTSPQSSRPACDPFFYTGDTQEEMFLFAAVQRQKGQLTGADRMRLIIGTAMTIDRDHDPGRGLGHLRGTTVAAGM